MLEIKQKPHLHATWIDRDAVDIVQRLQRAGHMTYLVGGCVRDLLAGIHPKDFDIATDALPNVVKKKVWGCYVIGKRFRLVLAKRGDQQFEIATFRRASRPEDFVEGDEAPVGDNFFGTPEEDALRRDFTINALFYDPVKDELIDFAHGQADVDARIIRMIGEPKARILDDAIRALRAVRLAHKLRFTIEPSLRAAIIETAATAKSVLPRRREEYLKLLRLEEPLPAFFELYDLQLMKELMPTLNAVLADPETSAVFSQYMRQALPLILDQKNTVEVYLPLIYAFSKALEHDPRMSEKREILMRDELGVFKAESTEILYIMELARNLPPVPAFKKRGLRRQSAFLSQPSLPLAVSLALLDYSSTPEELSYWISRLHESTTSQQR